jgi:lipoic acid synthetase
MASGMKDADQPRRLPPWLKKRLRAGPEANRVRQVIAAFELTTVCDGAQCPNLCECFARKTATFMILGDRCTRSCGFCAVPTGAVRPLRADEPQAVAEACAALGLRHVVVTSVSRDDLDDGGAGHFARTIRAVRARLPRTVIEVLTGDFQGSRSALDTVLDASPDVFNHNVETVPRLYPQVRPQANYRRSLGVLAHVAERAAGSGAEMHTKSGLMVGLGESDDEVEHVLADLREVDCDIVTIGQYLSPSSDHVPVARFVEPSQFARWQEKAKAMGFAAAAAGPFVRSSYHAEDLFRSRKS